MFLQNYPGLFSGSDVVLNDTRVNEGNNFEANFIGKGRAITEKPTPPPGQECKDNESYINKKCVEITTDY